MAVWRHAGDFDAARAAPLAWMATIVRNRALDRLRGTPREVSASGDEFLVEEYPDDAPEPAERLAQSAAARALRDCLGQLDGPQRQSITLAFLYGLSHGELAQHLEVPLGTAKSWVRRGLARLKDCLES